MGKYPAGATTAQQNSLLRAVRALGHDARGVMPADMLMEIKEISASSAALHLDMVSWADKSQSKCILGGTLSSQADGKTSTNALGSIHDDVRRDIANQDCLQIAGTITRDIVYPILMLNKGGLTGLRRCPRMVFDTSEAEDLVSYAESLPKLVSIGMKIPTRYVHEKLKMPQPEGDEEILGVQTPGLNSNVALSAQLHNTPVFTAQQQVIETGVDDVLSQVDSPIDPKLIYEALKGATDHEDLADRLAALMGSDSSEFERYLERATFAADVLGFVHV
jgi:phage gp29-like protein